MWLLCRQMNKHLKARKLTILFFSLLLVSCGESEIVPPSTSGTTPGPTTSVTPPGPTTESTSSQSSSSSQPPEIKCAVKFYVDSNVYYSCEVSEGETVTPPQNPSKLGYNFVKWINEDSSDWDKMVPIVDDNYNIYAQFDYDFLELPAIVIHTDDGGDVVTKDEYKSAHLSIMNAQASWQLDEVLIDIKGRGNTTWDLDKKPYRLKFDEKQSLFGSSYKAKSWTLIANHADKSLLRNFAAYELGERFTGLDFTSKHQLVDLYLNDEYKGVYLVCDQIQTGTGRVDIDENVAADGNNGYFIERDARAPLEGVLNQDYFIFNDEEYAFKTPDTEKQDYLDNKETEVAYITNYMSDCMTAITSGSWSDVQSLIDVDSFVDSYIIEEMFANNDCGYSSCYYYKDKDGKLFKGPLWDFDIGAGNVNYNLGNAEQCLPNTRLYAKDANKWYKALLARDEFVDAVVAAFTAHKSDIDAVLAMLDTSLNTSVYALYENALERNFVRWPVMGTSVFVEPATVTSITSLAGQIDYLYSWLLARYQFVYQTFLDM